MAHEYAKAFYKGSSWNKCKNGYLKSKNYICERCGEIATICHHKKHISPQNINDPNITLNWDNLQALCLDCHNSVHGKGTSCIKGISFDEEGNLVYKKVKENESG